MHAQTIIRVLLPALLFLSTALRLAAQDPVILSTLDEREILTTLFESDDYEEERGVSWSPNLAERLMMTVSEDGACHTDLYALLRYDEQFGDAPDSYAIAVFATYGYFDGVKFDCHACAPDIGVALFVQTGEGWVLLKFVKRLGSFGQWGEGGDAQLYQIGPDHPLLLLTSSFSGQGYTETTSLYYDLGQYNEIVEIFRLDESYGPAGCEEECDAEWCQSFVDISRTVVTAPNTDPESEYPGYDDLVVTTVEKSCRGVEASSVRRYRMERGGYREMRSP